MTVGQNLLRYTNGALTDTVLSISFVRDWTCYIIGELLLIVCAIFDIYCVSFLCLGCVWFSITSFTLSCAIALESSNHAVTS